MALTSEIDNGMLILRAEDGSPVHACPLEALVSWAHLLGTSSDVETLTAMMTARDPGVLDQETHRNAWTSAYEQAAKDAALSMNQTRMAAAIRPTSVSGALVPDGRAETRRLLGLSNVSLRSSAPVIDETSLATALQPYRARLTVMREKFEAGLRPHVGGSR